MIPFDDPDFFDKLILEGALEPSGVDEDGELLFNFTSKLPEVSPEMHEKVVLSIYDEVRFLWSHGFLDMNPTEVNPVVMITKKALNQEEIDKLTPHHRFILEAIKQASRYND